MKQHILLILLIALIISCSDDSYIVTGTTDTAIPQSTYILSVPRALYPTELADSTLIKNGAPYSLLYQFFERTSFYIDRYQYNYRWGIDSLLNNVEWVYLKHGNEVSRPFESTGTIRLQYKRLDSLQYSVTLLPPLRLGVLEEKVTMQSNDSALTPHSVMSVVYDSTGKKESYTIESFYREGKKVTISRGVMSYRVNDSTIDTTHSLIYMTNDGEYTHVHGGVYVDYGDTINFPQENGLFFTGVGTSVNTGKIWIATPPSILGSSDSATVFTNSTVLGNMISNFISDSVFNSISDTGKQLLATAWKNGLSLDEVGNRFDAQDTTLSLFDEDTVYVMSAEDIKNSIIANKKTENKTINRELSSFLSLRYGLQPLYLSADRVIGYGDAPTDFDYLKGIGYGSLVVYPQNVKPQKNEQ